MNGVIYGVVFTAIFSSHALCGPDGLWIGCPWEGPPAAINAVVLWDRDGDGPGPVRPFLATDRGVYVKGADGIIRSAGLGVDRVATMTTWDIDGDGPAPNQLVFVHQDSIFMPASITSVFPQPDGSDTFAFLGTFDSDVRSLTSYDTNGNGTNDLVAVGAFDSVQFEGNTTPVSKSATLEGGFGNPWSQLGTAPNSTCEVAKVIPCSSANSPIPCEGESTLVIGGFFTMAGGQNTDGVACWDDSAGDWVPCGGGTGLSGTVVVRDVAGWESDEGPKLIVAGFGIQVDGVSAGNIAHFDGTDWLPFGAGAFGNVQAVTTFDVDGDGIPDPVMAAVFNEGGGSFPYRAVYWDGFEWLPIGNGEFTSDNFVQVTDLLSADMDGAGGAPPELIVVGQFDAVGTTLAENLAIWSPNGTGGPCNGADLAEPFGEHNFFDVSAFLSLFIAQDPQADLNGDGLFNFFDVSAFLVQYAAGCP
jgi:hypothetical protein